MTRDNSTGADYTRRKFIVASGAAGVAGLAGCSGDSGAGAEAEAGGEASGSGGEGTGTQGSSGSQSDGSPLTADGSSTVYPITSDGAAVWNSNPPADDEEYWGPGQYDIDTSENMADYWGGLYGFSSSEEGQPPFLVNVGLSHSGTGVEKVKNGQVDIGDSSAPVEDELPDADQSTIDKFVDHVVGVDGQPIVVSNEIYEAGVTKLTGDELRAIYKKEITNWSEVGGPDREIQAVGRAEGSGTDTAFRANLYGDAQAEMSPDIRKGQNQQVATLVRNSDNAIAYMALAFVGDGVSAISLELDGKTYTPGENLSDKGYPLSRDLHCYTYDGTSEKESAFLRMLISDYGQTMFVEPNNYFVLSDARQEEEMGKLAEPSN
ncbi:PstS family phosphate ABC transporter substrate-binding protein [Halogeometricum limi]|uniref:Phosphate ABC transporter substrate-binding protein, PhoT family (TC 3.A.1.7.1) n=1 Tax=Halogeometricum limi TaxID=555875 RepID=A0A1I6HF53_9EURY|nr:PstS family phosphate ABC transporter substrate-binding protein [Halogeometricum limi]SFR52970.1 phosphate ABC transporter substrate-binding protein, PhoT family (TC 3.A.1.7.1) [Halogeometricum limi]